MLTKTVVTNGTAQGAIAFAVSVKVIGEFCASEAVGLYVGVKVLTIPPEKVPLPVVLQFKLLKVPAVAVPARVNGACDWFWNKV